MPKKNFGTNPILAGTSPQQTNTSITILPHSNEITNNIGNETGNFPKCRECRDATRINVVKNPRGVKWLRCGVCDLALRRCPDPDQLSRSPKLTREEREYCSKVACLSWFSGQVAGVLLHLENKAGEGMDHG